MLSDEQLASIRDRISIGSTGPERELIAEADCLRTALAAAQARIGAMQQRGDSLAGYATTLLDVLENPVYRSHLQMFITAWRALAPATKGSHDDR